MKPYENLSLEDMEGEVWKDVVGGEGLYQVSNMGRIKRLAGHGYGKRHIDRIMKQQVNKRPYHPPHLRMILNGVMKNTTVHRIVAKAFIPNPQNLPQIDHIDTDFYNNKVENLRWCSSFDNSNNPLTRMHIRQAVEQVKKRPDYIEKQRYNMPHSKQVEQYDLSGVYIASFRTLSEASRNTGCTISNISRCCHGQQIQTKGYIWKFKNINQN